MPIKHERRSTLNTFVVRLWCEPEEGQDRWRGQVQRLQSGERVEFSSEVALLSFIRRWVQMPDGRDSE